ncbi:MAG: 2,3-cyclic phosphodiesterase [Paenibacillaceae bacterium]|nr:2,3-cyclic phosphodiesterase [Paenibacillaceae bacterium]
MSQPRETNIRLFAALPLPEPLKAILKTDIEQLRKQLSFQKWVHPQDLHLTLVFLGNAAPSAIDPVTSRLREAAASKRPFSLRLQEAGVFGPPRSPRVLWAGIHGAVDALRELQTSVSDHLQTLGYMPEERPYSPHLTLARQYAGIGPVAAEALASAFPQGDPAYGWTADRLVLYRSNPGRMPMYEELESVPFPG